MPAGAYGDNISGMALAGAITAALLQRERTGKPPAVEVSLLAAGFWSMQYELNMSLLVGDTVAENRRSDGGSSSNPLSAAYHTSDDKWIMLGTLQPGPYWHEFVNLIGRPELAADERFNTVETLFANAQEAIAEVAKSFRDRTQAAMARILSDFSGQWSIVQDTAAAARDPQARANGLIGSFWGADGETRELVASPALFDGQAPVLSRAPGFAEHTDEVLREIGKSAAEIVQLQESGVVTRAPQHA